MKINLALTESCFLCDQSNFEFVVDHVNRPRDWKGSFIHKTSKFDNNFIYFKDFKIDLNNFKKSISKIKIFACPLPEEVVKSFIVTRKCKNKDCKKIKMLMGEGSTLVQVSCYDEIYEENNIEIFTEFTIGDGSKKINCGKFTGIKLVSNYTDTFFFISNFISKRYARSYRKK